MKLEQSFEVAAPVGRVWNALIDVEHVAPCLPGAAVTGRNEDGSYNGTFTVKIGPTTAAYAGKLQMDSVDEAAHTATMRANGTDKRGQGGAKATILSTVSPANGGTRVEVTTDYHITGRLARFGRGGMIEDISARLLREFAQRLQESLADQDGGEAEDQPQHAPQPSQPVQGLSVMSSVLLDRVRRNPTVAFVAGLLLAALLLRRARRGRGDHLHKWPGHALDD
jgi:carbon monoxide dehydrogenase subunit G